MAFPPLIVAPPAASGPMEFVLPARLQRLSAAERAVIAMNQGGRLGLPAAGETTVGTARFAGETGRAAAEARLAAAARGSMGAAPIEGTAAARAANAARMVRPFPAAALGGGGGAAAAAPAAVEGLAAAEGASAAGGGLLARLGLGRGGAAAAGGAAGRTGLVARLGGPAALRTAGGYALLGQLGGMGVEKVVGHREGTWDDAARNAAVGAGFGAGLGTLGGPFAPLTVPTGALLGAIGGGAYGFLTGKGSDEGEAAKAYDTNAEKFNDMFDLYQASPDLRQQFMMQFDIMTQDAKRSEVNDIAEQMRTVLPDLLMQDMQQRQEEKGRAAMYAAAQSWMAPMMQQAFGRQTQYANMLGQSMENSAGFIKDPASRAFALDEARRVPFDTATMQAYAMQQMASLPGLYGMQAQNTNAQGVPTNLADIMGAQPTAANAAAMQITPAMFPTMQQQPGPVGGQVIPGLQLD